MDDLFKIIFWIAIIISFIAPLFKKKEPDKKPSPGRRRYGEDDDFPVRTQSPTSVDKEEYDIMQEIERMFKTDTSQPTKIEQREARETRPTASEHVSYERSRSEGEYTSYEQKQRIDTSRKEAETRVTSSEHEITPFSRKREPVKKVDDSIEKQAQAFEKFLHRREGESNMAGLIRSRLKQPSSLKEYVIISEILNRPAVRKRGPYKMTR